MSSTHARPLLAAPSARTRWRLVGAALLLLVAASCRSPEEKARALEAQARSASQRGNAEEALALLDRAIEADPSLSTALVFRSDLLLQRGRTLEGFLALARCPDLPCEQARRRAGEAVLAQAIAAGPTPASLDGLSAVASRLVEDDPACSLLDTMILLERGRPAPELLERLSVEIDRALGPAPDQDSVEDVAQGLRMARAMGEMAQLRSCGDLDGGAAEVDSRVRGIQTSMLGDPPGDDPLSVPHWARARRNAFAGAALRARLAQLRQRR